MLVGPNDWEASRFRDGSQDLAGVPDSAADQEDHRFETASLSGLAAGPPAAKQGRLAQPDASKVCPADQRMHRCMRPKSLHASLSLAQARQMNCFICARTRPHQHLQLWPSRVPAKTLLIIPLG